MKIQLEMIQIPELHLVQNPAVQKTGTFSLKPKFSRQVLRKPGDGHAVVTLTMEIAGDDATPTPFDLKLTLRGGFRLENFAETDLPAFAKAATKDLFPYLKQTVTSACALCYQPPLVLPFPSDGILFPEDREPDEPQAQSKNSGFVS